MDYKELIRRLDNCGDFDGDLLDDATTAIETLLAERETAGWISVKDKLPEFYDWVLVAVKSVAGPSWLATAYRNRLVKSGDWYWLWFGYPSAIGEVTHWMPLPTPPDRESD